jgi:hypothetical protein
MYLDLTASFSHVTTPTPFGIYDSDTSFQSDANGMVRFVYAKLGGNVLNVEIRNKDVYAAFEEASLEYSAMINSYHAKSVLADLIASETGSLDGNQNKIPQMSLALQKKRAAAYSSEVQVGGTRTLYSSSIDLTIGVQNYNLNALLSSSGVETGSIHVEIKDIFHFSPTAAYRFFDTTSAVNYLHNQFSFESFTPETVFYLLPVWEDVLRAQQLELSHRVRRSNYSYNVIDNQLKIFPVPTTDATLHFTYYRNDQPAFDPNDPITNGVSNLSNVPFGNISYSKTNSLGKQWIRKMALALAKEILGQIRGKSSEIPIPNGALTLNGGELIAQAREEQGALREELKALLEATTYQALAAGLTEEAENLQKQLSKVPLPIFIG